MPRTFPITGLVLVLPLAWLWFLLIAHLQVEWSLNTQYSYGWGVPFLCGILLWRRLSTVRHPFAAVPGARRWAAGLALIALALMYGPTRLVEAANPDWRLVSWALALEVVGLTLLLVYAVFGRAMVARVWFPVVYFLVAVPWPISWLEQPVIQGLTRLDTSCCAEVLGWLGIPVIPHGNVIELANGVVGIDEACSGIRSFQATLMISLFLGEYARLNPARRAALVLAGFGLSFVFNAARMMLLVWVAAHQGVAAIAAWHDPAGVTILLLCFIGLWLLGLWLGGKQQAESRAARSDLRDANGEKQGGPEESANAGHGFRESRRWIWWAAGLCLWLVLVEISVRGWYRAHELRLPPARQWSLAWPETADGFKKLTVPEASRQILRYDEGQSASWREGDTLWQAVFLRWKPGQAAVHLAKNHTPNVCLTAAGHTLKSISPELWMEAGGFRMPFSMNQVMDSPQPLYVFYCLWDDRATAQGFTTMSLTMGNRLAPVLAGLRNPGQRSLELLVAGPATAAEAEAVVRQRLPQLIRPQ